MSLNTSQDKIAIHFVHAAPTPHNNYLLDALANESNVMLYRHYIFSPSMVPGRPWKKMGAGESQKEKIRYNVNKYFDVGLLKLALFDRSSVFFIVGWDYPILVLLLVMIGLRKRPLLVWDDGPTEESLSKINKWWQPKQLIKSFLIFLINRGRSKYFYTGQLNKVGFIRLGIKENKLEQLPFFVKPGVKIENIRTKHNCLSSKVLLLAGGRLAKDKGYDVLLESISLLPFDLKSKFKLVLIGSGPDKDLLNSLVQTLNLTELVDFVDWAEQDLFASYIHTCDIFVAPARLDRFPTTIVAAMQASVAIIATDKVGSAVEFLANGKTGFVIPSNDPQALANSIETLIRNSDLRKEFGESAYSTINEWPLERGVKLILDSAKLCLK
ncbi:MAG: hypothetical protein COA79_11405 [Planctomycetota bacterium]|nr:MAG: hypothetical protein COA79_11405 [Planctomycetota bacterium]